LILTHDFFEALKGADMKPEQMMLLTQGVRRPRNPNGWGYPNRLDIAGWFIVNSFVNG
jgi:hypothetical protein